jgi:hypothetical protein
MTVGGFASPTKVNEVVGLNVERIQGFGNKGNKVGCERQGDFQGCKAFGARK